VPPWKITLGTSDGITEFDRFVDERHFCRLSLVGTVSTSNIGTNLRFHCSEDVMRLDNRIQDPNRQGPDGQWMLPESRLPELCLPEPSFL
jgi:hypothetical protein